MRLNALFACLLLAVSNPLGATTVRGVIRANEMGGPGIPNVQVSALEGASPTVSLSDGTFVLEFPNKQPGEKVQLLVQNQGMMVVNSFELGFTLPKPANAEPLILLLCKAAERQEMVRRYYRLDRVDPIVQSYRKRLADLQAQNQATEAAKEKLRIERDREVEAAQRSAEELARVKAAEVPGFYAQPTPPVFHSDAAMAWNSLGSMYRRQNRMEKAREAYDEALRISRELVEKDPDIYLPDLEETLNNLGNMLSDQNMQEAQKDYEESLKISSKLAEQERETYLPAVAATLNNLGTLLHKQNRVAEARKDFDDALKSYHELELLNAATYLPHVAETQNNLGILTRDQNQLDEADKYFTGALTNYEVLARENPGKYAKEIESMYDNVLKIRRKLAEQNSLTYLPKVAEALNNLGTFLRKQNRIEEARDAFDEAAHAAVTLNNLGILKHDQNRMEEARTAFRGALSIYETLARKNPGQYAKEIESTYGEALKVLRKLAQQNPVTYKPEVADALSKLGSMLSDQNRMQEAREDFSEALAIYESLLVKNGLYEKKVELIKRLLEDATDRRKP